MNMSFTNADHNMGSWHCSVKMNPFYFEGKLVYVGLISIITADSNIDIVLATFVSFWESIQQEDPGNMMGFISMGIPDPWRYKKLTFPFPYMYGAKKPPFLIPLSQKHPPIIRIRIMRIIQ